MKQPVDFEKERKRKVRHLRIRRLSLLAVAVLFSFFVYAYRYELTSQGVGVLLSDTFASLTCTDNYPIALAEEPKHLLTVGSRPVICAAGAVTVYNPIGEEKATVRCSGQNTLAVSEGNYLLIYNRGGYDLRILSGETEVFHLKTDNTIQNATLSKTGAVAVATAQGATNTISVYSRHYRKIFEWNTTTFAVTALSLDNSAKKLAVGGVWSDTGILSSTLRVFSVTDGESLQEKIFSDELLLDAYQQADGDVCVITDSAAYLLQNNGADKRLEFESSLIGYTTLDNGDFVAAVGDTLATHETKIVCVDSQFSNCVSSTLSQNIKQIQSHGNELLLFGGERVLRLSDTLELKETFEMPGAFDIAATGNRLYYITVSGLYKLSLK